MRITEGRYLTMWAVRVVFQISSGPPRTSGRSTVPGEPLDDRRQLGEVARFGVRRGIGGTPPDGGPGGTYPPPPPPPGRPPTPRAPGSPPATRPPARPGRFPEPL